MINKFNKNRNKRTVDSQAKKIISKNCGFGCIFCGDLINQYEYIDPIYIDSSKHEEKVCLICPDCCQKIASSKISKQQLLGQANKPFAFNKEFSNDFLTFSPKVFATLGKVFYINTSQLIKINGVNILSVTQSIGDQPAKLNAKFYDDNNKLFFEIKDNEAIGSTVSWDIEQTENRIIIRRNKGKILLQIKFTSPDIFEIEKINMMYDGTKIYTDPNKGKIYIRTKDGQIFDLNKEQIIANGISITNKNIVFEKPITINQKENLKNKKLDYRAFIDTGKIQSE